MRFVHSLCIEQIPEQWTRLPESPGTPSSTTSSAPTSRSPSPQKKCGDLRNPENIDYNFKIIVKSVPNYVLLEERLRLSGFQTSVQNELE
jgi:hypothetical protein